MVKSCIAIYVFVKVNFVGRRDFHVRRITTYYCSRRRAVKFVRWSHLSSNGDKLPLIDSIRPSGQQNSLMSTTNLRLLDRVCGGLIFLVKWNWTTSDCVSYDEVINQTKMQHWSCSYVLRVSVCQCPLTPPITPRHNNCVYCTRWTRRGHVKVR